ncbi:uncharacterized protein CELE_C25A8.2 [Caenorhabditis elegans]|uniref:Uncharacterized protein n=1 Tax=Caenorhabditis elegans TaxID=6239 RepID=Q18144_CAEEL|nr:Uncharacterized protein CELE_C25A8.2 [Caenorhabditis elegans]CCD63428.1 Uncharacterized protein CELE_C25A8.2 [Caenorhabditis elegans]|eukprot:NP_501083.2 Uncharacterized protein CELE_C25A8.2 [Caenorhabditis elegans]
MKFDVSSLCQFVVQLLQFCNVFIVLAVMTITSCGKKKASNSKENCKKSLQTGPGAATEAGAASSLAPVDATKLATPVPAAPKKEEAPPPEEPKKEEKPKEKSKKSAKSKKSSKSKKDKKDGEEENGYENCQDMTPDQLKKIAEQADEKK